MPSLPMLHRSSTADRWEACYRAEVKQKELQGEPSPFKQMQERQPVASSSDTKGKRKQSSDHPYLAGNFAPVFNEFISHPADVVSGAVPRELLGGQYVRNGGNPIFPPEMGRHYHWFDGDGMLHAVLFPTTTDAPPLYTNRHLQTPLLSFSLLLLRPPLPSISTLIQPLSSLPLILGALIQGVWLAIRARLGVLSVANTSLFWWQTGPETGRLLATCESGPPLRVKVPKLETLEWERFPDEHGEDLSVNRDRSWRRWIRNFGMGGIQEDWMTAHPRVDPNDGSLIFYSCQMFSSPHLAYSVIDRHGKHLVWKKGVDVGRAKMMHDFATTRTMTILLNLPLTLSPSNLFSLRRPQPLIHFDRSLPSEFIVFPRLLGDPSSPQPPLKFTDPESCLIFHTANAWDTPSGDVEMLACRFKSAKLVYAAGAVEVPRVEKEKGKDDVVNLYYYHFALPAGYRIAEAPPTTGEITHAFPLSSIPFEFAAYPTNLSMSQTRYIYGCTMRQGSFDERLGGAAKVDCLVKVDVEALIRKGQARTMGLREPVDRRTVMEILESQAENVDLQVFALPEGWYAQEPRFVAREGEGLDEDDGYLVTYVYDESYVDVDGAASNAPGSGSELWIIDAKTMAKGMDAVLCRIKLPQRVPYGLHGTYIPAAEAATQQPASDLAPQALLQDKLHQSRLAYFFDIIFHRPSVRDKSKAEKVVLALMWPLAWMALIIAIAEAVRMSGAESLSDVGLHRDNRTL